MSVRKVRLHSLFELGQTLSNFVQCFTHIMLFPGIEDGLFKSLKWKKQESDVEVSWDPINLEKQSAFINGYVLYCHDTTSNETSSVSTGIVSFSDNRPQFMP